MNNFMPPMIPMPMELSFWDNILLSINTNKYLFAGLMMILNMGSRYLDLDLGPYHKNVFPTKIIRRLVIFTIAFMATRDVVASLLITVAFVVIVLNLFNFESDYCILPNKWKPIDTNNDGKISPQEIEKAYLQLKKDGKL